MCLFQIRCTALKLLIISQNSILAINFTMHRLILAHKSDSRQPLHSSKLQYRLQKFFIKSSKNSLSKELSPLLCNQLKNSLLPVDILPMKRFIPRTRKVGNFTHKHNSQFYISISKPQLQKNFLVTWWYGEVGGSNSRAQAWVPLFHRRENEECRGWLE